MSCRTGSLCEKMLKPRADVSQVALELKAAVAEAERFAAGSKTMPEQREKADQAALTLLRELVRSSGVDALLLRRAMAAGQEDTHEMDGPSVVIEDIENADIKDTSKGRRYARAALARHLADMPAGIMSTKLGGTILACFYTGSEGLNPWILERDYVSGVPADDARKVMLEIKLAGMVAEGVALLGLKETEAVAMAINDCIDLAIGIGVAIDPEAFHRALQPRGKKEGRVAKHYRQMLRMHHKAGT